MTQSTPNFHYTFTPRSIADRDYWGTIGADPNYTGFRAWLEEITADLPDGFPATSAADFMASPRHNDRSLLDHHWHWTRQRLSALAVRRCLRGIEDDDPDDRLLNWLWGALTEPTWAVVAHLPENDLPAGGAHVLDLAACEMAALLAEFREMLLPWLNQASSTIADRIVYEIDLRILNWYGADEFVSWHVPGNRMSNWTGVCAGSVLTACESLAAQGHPRPAARSRALAGLAEYLQRAYTPNGECDEGLGYWTYGMEYASMGWSRLSAPDLAAHTDYGRFRQIADYPRRAHLFGPYFYSGNDAGLLPTPPLGLLPWLAAASNNSWLWEWFESSRTDPAPPVLLRHLGQMLRYLAAPSPAGVEPAAPETVLESAGRFRYLPDQQVAILRETTPAGEFLVALSGGSNDELHNHNDLGHFLVAHGGEWIIPDMGCPFYTRDFFGPKRYKYIPASSRGHCCPLINGVEQYTQGGRATVLDWSPGETDDVFGLDLTAAYPPEAGLQRWTRTLHYHGEIAAERHVAIFTDVFQTAAAGAPIAHVLWSLVEPLEIREAGTALKWKLGPVHCHVTPAPANVTVEPFTAEELNLREWNGRTLYCMKLQYETGAAHQLTVVTTFRP